MKETQEANPERTLSIGLALGGGAVLGAAHVGVLRALDELAITAGALSGTSIGSFIAALHAFGMGWREIEEIAHELDWLDLTGLTLSQFGLLSNKKFGRVVRDLLGKRRIEESPLPLAIVATDIGSGEKVVLKNGDVAEAVMASSCIPAVFRPVEIGGRMLVDGVLMENVPLSPLQEQDVRPLVCVDLMGGHIFSRPDTIVDLLLNAFYSTLKTTTAMQIEEADLTIAPDLGEFSLVDTRRIPELVEVGYRDSLPLLKRMKDEATA
ncbi:MAG: patatin-like phospholipase family protein [Chlorobium phaeobacteroides]|uniref:Patatin n=1 Tax=Chlorobium phaeobacteroides (strain BS1) TaxID=331678 RepID=B3EN39_CHLPB|nr:patatin-like phospholipase family protein [Chlorobium phaeobacteroides]